MAKQLHFPFFIYVILGVVSVSHIHCGADFPANEEGNEETLTKRPYMEETISIDTASVQVGTFQKEIISNGKLSAVQASQLRFKLEGEITHIYVRNGQRVRKGDTLAALYPFAQENKLSQANRNLAKAQLDLQDVLLSFGYKWEDRDSLPIPENIVKMARSKSGFAQALTDREVAEHEYHQLWLTAPFSGLIANLEAKPYNMTQDFDPFCHLLGDRRFEVEFFILETEFESLQKGQQVSLSPFALPEEVFTGKVKEINPIVNENGMINVTAVIDNPRGRLLTGMNVKLFLKNEVDNQLIIPKASVVQRQGRDVVFTYQNDTAFWHYVTLDLENSTQYSVTEGLDPSAIVITEGNLNLAHKVPVRVEK